MSEGEATRIRAEGVGVRFLFDRQRRLVTPTLARLRRRGTEAWGLHDVTFTAEPGEGIALLGASGSGKTTLLRLLAGVYGTDAGTLAIHGRIGSLLSIEAGLLGLLTGRENAALLGVLAGLPYGDATAQLDAVRDRSGLGDAFERPVSSFSQGMRARIGFAVAERSDPTILLLDEVHEALDHAFREIVEERARAILAAGGIVIAAGHDHEMLARLCSRGFQMEGGRIVRDGPLPEVRAAYVAGAHEPHEVPGVLG